MATRGGAGCRTCHIRHKKCDETRPKCQRCTKSGVECGGYGPLEHRDAKPKRKIRPETSGLVDAAALPTLLDPIIITDPAVEFKSLGESVGMGLNLEAPFDFSMPVDNTWHPSLQQTLPPPINIEIIDLTAPEPSSMPGPSKPSGLEVARRSKLSAGQASLYQALFSLAKPDQASPLACSSPSSSIPSGSLWSPNTDRDNASDTSEDDDPEGARHLWCTAPVMDSCVVSNSLPYVLQSYATWLNYTMFEPLRLVYPTRECVIAKFASPESRSRIILIANAMSMLRKAANPQGVPLVSKLTSRVHQTVTVFKSSSRSNVPGVDQQNARSALDNIVEVHLSLFFSPNLTEFKLQIMGITIYSSPLSSVIHLMQDAAPVFRYACPEPLTQLVSLPELLLGPWVHLRYFAVTDVTLSITTGRPMFFRYDVEFSLQLYEQMETRKTNFGLTWMHGMPDPLVLLFAWMNNLREEGGVGEELVARIERDVQDLKIGPGNATDPALKVGRLVVQECWRQAVYIYLYMALCGVPADDPRVKKAVKTFMRLVNGTSPGRNPDAFLVVPAIIAGVAARRPRDRNTLRTRLAALPECKPGTCRHDSLLILDDVWSRAGAQARAAVWSDLRLGCLRISGM